MTPPRITEIKYGRTINVGNYESVRFDFTAEVPIDRHPMEVLEDLKLLGLREEKRVKREKF